MDVKFLFVLFKLLLMLALTAAEQCIQTDSCSCKTSKYTVSLHSLAAKHNPSFSVESKDGYTYTYQPCEALATKCTGDSGTAVCQSSGTHNYVAGFANTSSFAGDPEMSNLILTYTALTDTTRISSFYLICSTDDASSLSYVNDTITSTVTTYNFILRAKACCGNSNKISTGSVLVIIFFVLLAVYFIVGFLFLKFARGAKGLELIPNYEFWSSLPGLIKDGVLFTFRGCKTDGTYSKI